MKLKDLKPGTLFTIRPINNPKESQVFIRGEYDRSEKRYECGKYDDVSASRIFDGNKQVFIDFEF